MPGSSSSEGIEISLPLPIGYHQHPFPGSTSGSNTEHTAQSNFASFFSTQLFIDLLAAEAIAVGLSFLFEFVIAPAWPGLFPLPDLSVYFFLPALSLTAFYARLQYDEHAHALRQLYRTVTLLEEAEPALDATARSRITAALHSLLESKTSPDLFASVQSLRANSRVIEQLYQLATSVAAVNCRSLAVLSRLSIYLWALALPWFLWHPFRRFTLLLLPVVLLPALALRQYGLDRRTRSRRHFKKAINPSWEPALQRLARFAAGPPESKKV